MYTFVCPNRKNVLQCPFCDSKGHLWGNREEADEDVRCGQDESIICNPYNYTPQITGQKMTKSAIKADRQKRATNHFKESVYGAGKLSQQERKHYSKTKGFKL